MKDEEAKKMLKAKLECFKNETSGINHDCNMRLCDGCSLNYEQGNMGEQKEALETAIKALEEKPCETIKEIPKDYKYDTETEDFLVYRHKYTGHEIHIEKPVPRYRLEQHPCEDCISRAAVLDKKELVELEDGQSFYCINPKDVETLPSVTPARPKGYWIERTFPYMIHDYKCSECGETIEAIAKSNFCPCCGADMRGDEDAKKFESNV